MSRYLNLSELAHVRWLASETMRRRRPRRAGRVRAYAAKPRALSGSRSPRPPRPPLVPSPRRPLDTAPLDVLHAVLAGLHRLGVSL
ncbi:hypothetical protein GCM10007079_16020 [Nocardiopsis terrae]|uniref:Uncharacterized protein n=1 Tax=Nocardiopsis terrae TaxID=372655 RepID=A0ABR9HIA5_9ACTN|nr:hypothetical protein [Nocardiopsis terrae]MBE1458767.1 hypothetical protein [Nocardiopsis terrae]GHC78594.1 hypothetical protein GCM10007079_16020 [Nocardiopsis terrae]